jgi:energy-coupling factor transport system ATP-binding protein
LREVFGFREGLTIENHETILEAKGVRFVYPGDGEDNAGVEALAGIDLAIRQGEYVALIGPNGSGKTTLLKHFNALLKPSAGAVLVGGLNTADEANLPAIRRQCGMIFQNPDNQLVATTVEEDVAFGLENYALPPAEIRRRVAESLHLLGLSELAQHPPHLLSGGEKQRVAIAGILAMRPRCLLMDEPTAMLDPGGQKEVLETVRRLNSGTGITVLHVTHFPAEAALAGRVVIMHRGRVAAQGPPARVLTDLPLLHGLGLRGTVAAELAALLREDGLRLSRELLHDWELIEQLCSSGPKT